MWRNLPKLGINKDGQPRAAVLHKIGAGQRGIVGPAPLPRGLLQAVKFSDTPFDLLRPRDRGFRLKTVLLRYFMR